MSKPDLSVRWSKRERALLYHGSKPTGGMLATHFETTTAFEGVGEPPRSLVKELEARGYDITTLRFSVRKKAVAP